MPLRPSRYGWAPESVDLSDEQYETPERRLYDPKYLLLVGLVGAAYFVGAHIGLALAFSTKQVSAVWPPTGIALAALLLAGKRVWPGIFLAALLINALTHEPLAVACCIAVGNTLTGLLGAWALRAMRFDASLSRSRDVASLLIVAIVSTLVSATLGTTILVKGSIAAASAYSSIWWVWWTGDSLGILVAAPALLTWIRDAPGFWRSRAEIREFAAHLVVTILIGLTVFVLPSGGSPLFYPRAYVSFPLLAWAGLRLGPRTTTLGIAILAACAVWGSFHGHGPFSQGSPDSRLILLDAFLATVGCTGLLIAAVTAERQGARLAAKESEARLRQAYEELEVRVRERTAELAAALAELNQRHQEKEILLREIHHRVKNNLQVVCSLLNLQAERRNEPGLNTFAADCRARVRSMALVHEHLYQSKNMGGVPFAQYVRALVEEVAQAQQAFEKVAVNVDVRDDVALSVDQATPCGLIVNELVTNALKHGFPGALTGQVDVRISCDDNEWVHLEVRDNGVGIPENIEPAADPSFGLTLISMLVDQLQATFTIERAEGTYAHVAFVRRRHQPVIVASDPNGIS